MSVIANVGVNQLLEAILLACSVHPDADPATAWIHQASPSCFLIQGERHSGKSALLAAIQQTIELRLAGDVQVCRQHIAAQHTASCTGFQTAVRWVNCPQHAILGRSYVAMVSAHSAFAQVEWSILLARQEKKGVLLLLDDIDMLLEHSITGGPQAASLLGLLDVWCCPDCTAFCESSPAEICDDHWVDVRAGASEHVGGINAHGLLDQLVPAFQLPSVTIVITCSDLSHLPDNFNVAGELHILQLVSDALSGAALLDTSILRDATLQTTQPLLPNALRKTLPSRSTAANVSGVQEGKLTVDCLIALRPPSHMHLSSMAAVVATDPWAGLYGYDRLKRQLQAYAVDPFLAFVVPTASSSVAILSARLQAQRVHPLRGCVLFGPTGCGKTSLAKGICKACGLRSLVIQCPQLVSKYVGDSEAAVRKVFETARQLAPCVLVLDELDTIASKREGEECLGAGATVKDRMLSTLLNELDGVGERPDKRAGSIQHVLVVGISTDLHCLDAALLRSGRLELHIECHRPTADDIRDIILEESGHHLDGALLDELIGRCTPKETSCAQIRSFATSATAKTQDGQCFLRELESAMIRGQTE